ncbi:MAG: hypothetical protein JWQ76_5608 [Ramlibacter sp.]|nr:hypothetical protein [Ramlibacter sp.]
MTFPSANAPPQRQRFGSSLQVVLVLSPPALLQRMSDIVGAIGGTLLAGRFATPADAVDWIVWKRPVWHVAYVDMTLPGAEEVVRSLQGSQHAGTIVGVCDHLWREVRDRCSAIGVRAIVEKGDLIAFQGDLETRAR